MTDDEQIPLIQGDDQEPDVQICPALDETVPEDTDIDQPTGLSEESYAADATDDKGLHSLCSSQHEEVTGE
jgi:hypothetical protein